MERWRGVQREREKLKQKRAEVGWRELVSSQCQTPRMPALEPEMEVKN